MKRKLFKTRFLFSVFRHETLRFALGWGHCEMYCGWVGGLGGKEGEASKRAYRVKDWADAER